MNINFDMIATVFIWSVTIIAIILMACGCFMLIGKMTAIIVRSMMQSWFLVKLWKSQRKQELLQEEKKSINPYNKNKENYVKKALITAVAAALLFIIAAIIADKRWGLAISPDNVVLTFVGILATFIVVTNYAQVLDIKRDLDQKVALLERRMKQQQRAIVSEKNYKTTRNRNSTPKEKE